jgi:hypothetical protein
VLKNLLRHLIRKHAADIIASDAVKLVRAGRHDQYIVFVNSEELSESIIKAVNSAFDSTNMPDIVVVVADETIVMHMGKSNSTHNIDT